MASPEIDFITTYGGWILALLAALAAIITPILTRRTGRDTVEVNEKEASTRAVAGVISALTVGFEELRTEVGELKTKNEELEGKVFRQGETIVEQGVTIKMLVKEREEMVRHIVQLEEAFPNPPGAPLRPDWLQHL